MPLLPCGRSGPCIRAWRDAHGNVPRPRNAGIPELRREAAASPGRPVLLAESCALNLSVFMPSIERSRTVTLTGGQNAGDFTRCSGRPWESPRWITGRSIGGAQLAPSIVRTAACQVRPVARSREGDPADRDERLHLASY